MSEQHTDVLDAHPVASYFVLATAFSWVGWLPLVQGVQGLLQPLRYVAGGFGPALAGAVVTWLDGGSVRAWARQIVRWRVAPRWYLAAVARSWSSSACSVGVRDRPGRPGPASQPRTG